MQYLIASLSYQAAEQVRRRKAGEDVSDTTIGIWHARDLKNTLRLDDDLEPWLR